MNDAVVVVTGAGGGLGGAMARGLLAAGRRVAAVDHEPGAGGLAALERDAAAAESADRLYVTTADVRSVADAEGAIERALARFGAVHALVNNAGIGPYRGGGGSFLDVPVAYWQRLIDTNVNGPYLMTRAIVPHLVAQRWGRIVNVTTSLATMVMDGMAPYGPAKAALEAASAIWAKEMAGTGVTVNVLVPGGAADTAMVPLERAPDRSALISPQVMVAPIVWLTSEDAAGTTGRRFIGKAWDPAAPVADNLRAAGAPIAWDLA